MKHTLYKGRYNLGWYYTTTVLLGIRGIKNDEVLDRKVWRSESSSFFKNSVNEQR